VLSSYKLQPIDQPSSTPLLYNQDTTIRQSGWRTRTKIKLATNQAICLHVSTMLCAVVERPLHRSWHANKNAGTCSTNTFFFCIPAPKICPFIIFNHFYSPLFLLLNILHDEFSFFPFFISYSFYVSWPSTQIFSCVSINCKIIVLEKLFLEKSPTI
jgi:hypothetical protein